MKSGRVHVTEPFPKSYISQGKITPLETNPVGEQNER